MFALITILVIIVCVLLLLIVLIQNPKGGLDSAFSSNNQVMGVRKTADFLEKATWSMGIALVILSIASAAVKPSRTSGDETSTGESKIQELTDEKAAPVIAPNMNQAPNNTTQGTPPASDKEGE